MNNNKWDNNFIGLARHIAQWSKDPSSKCGAVITNGKFIVNVGYNGFAKHIDDSPEHYSDRDYKLENVIHCEENAIISAQQDLTCRTMYITCMSCSRCTARIIQTGITRVVVPCKEEDPFSYRDDWNDSFERAKAQLFQAQVSLTVLNPTGFDPLLLMGPEHPEQIKIAKARLEAIRRIK